MVESLEFLYYAQLDFLLTDSVWKRYKNCWQSHPGTRRMILQSRCPKTVVEKILSFSSFHLPSPAHSENHSHMQTVAVIPLPYWLTGKCSTVLHIYLWSRGEDFSSGSAPFEICKYTTVCSGRLLRDQDCYGTVVDRDQWSGRVQIQDWLSTGFWQASPGSWTWLPRTLMPPLSQLHSDPSLLHPYPVRSLGEDTLPLQTCNCVFPPWI